MSRHRRPGQHKILYEDTYKEYKGYGMTDCEAELLARYYLSRHKQIIAERMGLSAEEFTEVFHAAVKKYTDGGGIEHWQEGKY